MTHILIVDDDAFARRVYADMLASHHHEVGDAGSGDEALAYLASHPVAVMVTDLLMPGMDGHALLDRVRKEHPEVPVIVLTAVDSVDDAVRALRNGAVDYLVKPVNDDVLQFAIERCLATKALLSENAQLKAHVEMYGITRRIGACLETDKLREAILEGVARALGAPAAMYLDRRDSGEWAVTAALGVAPGGAQLIAADLVASGTLENLEGDNAQALRWANAIENFHGGLAIRLANTAGERRGAVLALFMSAAPEATGRAAQDLEFIARSSKTAWDNAARFTDAQNLVYVDALTGLYNGSYLAGVLDREIARYRRYSRPFAVLFLDLDHFKAVNDTHGHQVGSQLLIEVSKILKRACREHDVCVRYGGDEYVVLLAPADMNDAMIVAERIRAAVAGHAFLAREGFSLQITCCVGVAVYPEHASDRDALIRLADEAMYRGKRGTRNVVYMTGSPAAEARVQTAT